MKYPDNFSRSELLYSQTAARKGIDNTPIHASHEKHLCYLAWWLQALRDALSAHYQRDVVIDVGSGYRVEALNTAVGGSSTSQHKDGTAADIKARGLSTVELATFIEKNFFNYDQLIEEYGRWVHVGLPVPNLEVMQIAKGTRYKTVSFVAD